MDAIFVYCLVPIFFIALFILAATVLKSHPSSMPSMHQQTGRHRTGTAAGSTQATTANSRGYLIVALILALLFVISAFRSKKQASASQ